MADYKIKAIMPTDLQLSGFHSQTWEVKPDGIVDIDDFLSAEMFKNVSKNLSVYDIIRILPCNEAFYAEVMVSSITKTSLGVKIPTLVLLRKIELREAPVAANEPEDSESPYEIRWQGGKAKHAIVRKSDKMVIETGIARKIDAIERAKALAA
jgi:hypothetical protein